MAPGWTREALGEGDAFGDLGAVWGVWDVVDAVFGVVGVGL